MLERCFRSVGFLVGCLLSLALLSCDDGSEDGLSGPGESCTTQDDCLPEFECILGVCRQEGPGCPNTGDCTGLECGPDPVCGVLCGVCAGNEICQDSKCVEVKPGPWLDPTTQLYWENPAPDVTLSWEGAIQYCEDLTLDNGAWHLPTIDELRSLIDGCPVTDTKGSCNVSEGDCLGVACKNEACDGCDVKSGWGDVATYWPDRLAGECCRYWSSTPVAEPSNDAWFVNFNTGQVFYQVVGGELRVRCVK